MAVPGAAWKGCTVALGLSALWAGGCGLVSELFNTEFLNAAGLGRRVATVPGEAPAVLVEVENRTGRVAEAQLSWRQQESNVRSAVLVIPPGASLGQVLVCPVEELTLGDVGDLDRVGAIIRLGGGGVEDPIVEIEPFGVLLQERVNYDCGDVVTFAIVTSQTSGSGYQIVAFIQRSGNAP